MSKKEDKLNQKALDRCLEIIKGINDLGEKEEHFELKMKMILSAFNAIKIVFAGTDVYCDERHIVASAIISDGESFPYHPYSKVGETVCALIQVCLLMNVASDLDILLVGDQCGTSMADDIIKLLDKRK